MTLFIHLQIKPIAQIQFRNEWVEMMKTEFPEALIFEADSHSEPFVISQGVSFLKEAEKVVLCLDSNQNEKLGSCAPLIEKVFRNKAIAPFILIQGENAMFEKMAKMMKKEVFKCESVEESLVQIRNFLNH
ncbi:hypothetical protein [Roseivirga sp.]|uniref:hypothetical protein n=1 Tax=Roseivirga sp. TaxID=1964215 RepID=UPI002B27A370|nr:hypothetical protein [Roseivirga sp.]